jgi:probable addiction module antidote protein
MTKSTNAATNPAYEIRELRSNRRLAFAYARTAVESLNIARTRAFGLLALRFLAEAHGGLGAVAAKAGISRESLYRSLSPKGNPTLKTLVAVLNTMGLSLSVVPQQKRVRKRAAKKPAKAVRVRVAA